MDTSALLLRFSSRRRSTLIAVFLALAFLIVFTSRSTVLNSYGIPPLIQSNEESSKDSSVAKDFFHLLIPATESDLNLCKTVLSAAVLNYSTPVLINWDKKYDDESLSSGGSHLAKISGVLSYLNSIGKERDDDLVLIVDGYDTWFQLRPEILISRYHDINSRANKRITNRLGTSGPSTLISQSVIFSSQKLCWPHTSDELACYAAPPSPTRPDLFGSDTDKPYPDQENPYLHTRQRFMNSGLMMGPVGALKRLLTESEMRMAVDKHGGSDQGIFSDILGAQEYSREVIRKKYLSSMGRFCAWLGGLFWGKNEFDRDRDELLKPDPAREMQEMLFDKDPDHGDGDGRAELEYEYGIGLDYGSELSHATVFAQRDADWISFDSLGSKPSRFWHINSPLVKTLPDDIKMSKLPFSGLDEDSMRSPAKESQSELWKIDYKDQTNRHSRDEAAVIKENSVSKSGEDLRLMNVDATWEHVPLYTHLWSGNIPVSIHHNAWQRNMKSHREKMWKFLWWQPFARELLDAHIRGPRSPVVVETGFEQENGKAKSWWSPVENKGGARADNGTWYPWESLCGEWDWDLFEEK